MATNSNSESTPTIWNIRRAHELKNVSASSASPRAATERA